jgi:hypothetical protein
VSVKNFTVQVCNRCGNAFDESGEGRPRTSTMDFKVRTGGGGSWPSDNEKHYCEPCTELIEDVLKPELVAEEDRVYPEDVIRDRRVINELNARMAKERQETKRLDWVPRRS